MDGLYEDIDSTAADTFRRMQWNSAAAHPGLLGISAARRKRSEIRHRSSRQPVTSLPLPVREPSHTHGRFFADPDQLATAKNPFQVSPAVAREADAALDGKDAREALSMLKQQLAVSDQSIPTLYRQYVDLCEPDGVRFLAFGIDPQFGGCVDGLIRLDLTRLKAAKRARYL